MAPFSFKVLIVPIEKPQGHLWVIATPIGNLGDFSPRAREIMESLDLLACENLNSAKRLCSALQIRCPKLLLYREDSGPGVIQKLVRELEDGRQCGLISDAGSPGLSDPGWRLVSACHENDIGVTSVAGPSSLTAALAVAGVPTRRFAFEGFPPHKKSDRLSFFQRICQHPVTTVFFESPHNILNTMQILQEICQPDRLLSISRELSKLHESTRRLRLEDWCRQPPPAKGEFVLILEAAPVADDSESLLEEQCSRQSQYLSDCNLSAPQIRDFLVQFCGASRNQAYRIALSSQQKISSIPE